MIRASLMLVLCPVVLAATAQAADPGVWQATRTGELRPIIFTGHVLTSPRDGGMLYAPSEDDNPSFRAEVSAACGGIAVDYFDARIATPTVELMLMYDCVLTWTNYAYDDYMEFGDNLADYVDAGGRVVLGQWSYFGLGTTGAMPDSRIIEEGYCPVTVVSYSSGMYAGDGVTCFHAGVTSYTAGYRDNCVLREGALSDGTFTDGWPAVCYRPDFRVIYLPGQTGLMYTTGDWALLAANAFSCGTPGDLNCDGALDSFDVDPFVMALSDPDTYAVTYPSCSALLADCNDDGLVNAFDIDPFVDLLIGE